jgi:hypothetical protein
MNPIFLVAGPPAVGKSTTSSMLAARFPKSLYIPVDDIRHMVRSGIVLPSNVWSDALVEQVSLARRCVVQTALTYHHAGFVVVIDDFLNPSYASDYQTLLAQTHVHRIVLYPAQRAAHERNMQRSGVGGTRDYIDEGIDVVYRYLRAASVQLEQRGWLIVDTTTLSVETTVATILERTASTCLVPI